MIDYIDFVPELIEPMTWRQQAVYETMKEVRARVRAWQASETYKVINVETVLRPLYTYGKEAETQTGDALFAPSHHHMAQVFGSVQVVRVWFDDGL